MNNLLSVDEQDIIYNVLEDLINNLDSLSLKELLSGNEKDIDHIFQLILEESHQVLSLGKNKINLVSVDYLKNIQTALNEVYLKSSLNYFILNALPHFDLQFFHLEWCNYVHLYRLFAILAARGHGKSYFFSFAVVLWKLYRYRKPNVLQYEISKEIFLCKEGMIITNRHDFATTLLRKVRTEIETNDILGRVLYPDGRGESWGNEGIICKNGAEVKLSSFGSSNRGPHPGWIIVDDFLDKSALFSNIQREKFNEVFFAEIYPMLLPEGQLIVDGTPFHDLDLYGKLKLDKRFKVFEYPAIFPDGSVLYPQRFSFKELLDIKKTQGTLLFSREYLVKPVTDASTIFPWDILKKAFIGMDDITLVDNVHSYPVKFKKVCVGCDFAKSGSIGADFTCYTVWGVDSLNVFHLIHVWRKKGASTNEQISQLVRINNNFKPDRVIIETNGFQKVMLELAQQSGINRAEGFNTDGQNKKDPYEGIPALSVLFERGLIRMPRGDEKSRATIDLVCSEFNSITFTDKGKLQAAVDHDDTVMSCFFALRSMQKITDEISISFV